MAFEIAPDEFAAMTSQDDIYAALLFEGTKDNIKTRLRVVHLALGRPDFFFDVTDICAATLRSFLAVNEVDAKWATRALIVEEMCRGKCLKQVFTSPVKARVQPAVLLAFPPGGPGPLGTPTQQAAPATPPGVGGLPPALSPGGVTQALSGSAAIVPFGKVSGGMKLDVIVNPSLKSDLVAMADEEICDRFTRYQLRMGAPPDPDHEPTSDQLSAVNQLIKLRVAPFVDFLLFGPHQKRFLFRSTFQN